MQSSQKKINKTLESSLEKMLNSVLAEIDTPEEMAEVLKNLLTDGERTALVKRLGIALYLDKGRSYEDIKNNIMVSSATIASVAEAVGETGWQTVITRIKAEDWAEAWSKKITSGMKKVFG
jgi:uncharacterized protein YerC